MRKFNLLVLSTIVMAGFSACSSDNEQIENPLAPHGSVRFSSKISTRVSGSSWDSGDAIGVYALNEGKELADANIYNAYANMKYLTTGDGEFTSTSPIKYPDNGKLDFIAYYPHAGNVSGYTLALDVANQAELPLIDVLYSNNATGKSKTDASVDLRFTHKLSLLVLNIEAGDGISALTGLNTSIGGLTTDGTFNLTDGSVTLGSASATLAPTATVNAKSAIVNAIVLPGQNLNAATVTFTVEGKTYTWKPESQELAPEKQYTYPLQLSATGEVIVSPNSTITDWVEGNTGGSDIVLTPDGTPSITVDVTTLNFAKDGEAKDIVLTAESSLAWTAVSTDAWLILSPASGTGNATLTATALTNPGAARTASITITPEGGNPVTVSVTQAGGVTPTANLLFPGSDFEDWSAFTGALNSYGLKYAVQSTDGGRNGSAALHLNTAVSKNDYVFTALVPAGFTAPTSNISFYIKGTTNGKSLSINAHTSSAVSEKFNLENIGAGDVALQSAGNTTTSNSYAGSIDTGGNWVKVTLNLNGITLNTAQGESLLGLKVGKDATYDLYIDDITYE